MRFSSLLKKCAVSTFSLLTLFSLQAPVASADNGGNTVIFGDSLFANPTYAQLNLPHSWGGSSEIFYQGKKGSPSPQGCPQGDSTVGNVLMDAYGYNVINYACSAAKAGGASKRNNFYSQASDAIYSGRLNSGTKNVLIQFGFNDAPGIMTGVNGSSVNSESYFKSMSNNIKAIKKAAPNAKITLVSYPALSASNGTFCPVRTNVGTDATGAGLNMDFLGSMSGVERHINSSMFNVAKANGVFYFDLNSESKSHSTCAPNDKRWIAGALEFSLPHNLAIHYTHKGNSGVAGLLNDKVLVR